MPCVMALCMHGTMAAVKGQFALSVGMWEGKRFVEERNGTLSRSPRIHARVRVAPAMRARVWTVETSEKGFAARVAQTAARLAFVEIEHTFGTWTSLNLCLALQYLGPRMTNDLNSASSV